MSSAINQNTQVNSIFNKKFLEFGCSEKQSSLLCKLLQKNIAYPSTYLWERLGIGVVQDIGESLYLLHGENLHNFQEKSLPKIRKIFQKSIALLFSPEEERRVVPEKEWKKEQDVVLELKGIAKNLSEAREKEIILELAEYCQLFFVHKRQNPDTTSVTYTIDATHLLATQKIRAITDNYIPSKGSREELEKASQSIITFQAWVLEEGSLHHSSLMQCKAILEESNKPVADLLRHMQKVSRLAKNEIFAFFFRQFLTAAGLLLLEDSLGNSLKNRMVESISCVKKFQSEASKRRNTLEGTLPSLMTDFAKNFITKRIKLDDELQKQPHIIALFKLISSQMGQLVEQRIGNYLSLFFLIAYELLRSDTFSHEELLENFLSMSKLSKNWKDTFQTKWKSKLAKFGAQPDRDKAEYGVLQRALEIESIHNPHHHNFFPFLLQIQLHLHQFILGGLRLLFNADEDQIFTQCCVRTQNLKDFFSRLTFLAQEAIHSWPESPEIPEDLSSAPTKKESKATSISKARKKPKKKKKKKKKETTHEKEPTEKLNSNHPEYTSLHEQAIAEIEKKTKEKVTEKRDNSENLEVSSTTEEVAEPAALETLTDSLQIAVPRSLRDMNRFLRGENFVAARWRGSHQIWTNPATGEHVSVPNHPGRRIPYGTARNIVKKATENKKGNE